MPACCTTANTAELRKGELLLIDAGCEPDSYASDTTRTFPIAARFSAVQRHVYELVLASQEAAIKAVRPGADFIDYPDAATRVLVQGFIDFKLCKGSVDSVLEDGAYKQFYMHRTGHWLGLDVHDAGDYMQKGKWRKLKPGMVLTVEPGTYIRPAPNVPKAFWNIGVRIEDDVLWPPRAAMSRRRPEGGEGRRGRGPRPLMPDVAIVGGDRSGAALAPSRARASIALFGRAPLERPPRSPCRASRSSSRRPALARGERPPSARPHLAEGGPGRRSRASEHASRPQLRCLRGAEAALARPRGRGKVPLRRILQRIELARCGQVRFASGRSRGPCSCSPTAGERGAIPASHSRKGLRSRRWSARCADAPFAARLRELHARGAGRALLPVDERFARVDHRARATPASPWTRRASRRLQRLRRSRQAVHRGIAGPRSLKLRAVNSYRVHTRSSAMPPRRCTHRGQGFNLGLRDAASWPPSRRGRERLGTKTMLRATRRAGRRSKRAGPEGTDFLVGPCRLAAPPPGAGARSPRSTSSARAPPAG